MNRTVRAIMEVIDREGMPPMSKEDWRDLLEEIIDECQVRLAAVWAELVHGEG